MDGKKLKSLRVTAGMSQAELAEKAGYTQATISHWENNERRIFTADVVALAQILRVEVSELLT